MGIDLQKILARANALKIEKSKAAESAQANALKNQKAAESTKPKKSPSLSDAIAALKAAGFDDDIIAALTAGEKEAEKPDVYTFEEVDAFKGNRCFSLFVSRKGGKPYKLVTHGLGKWRSILSHIKTIESVIAKIKDTTGTEE